MRPQTLGSGSVAGSAISIVMLRAAEALLVLPAGSVTLAVMEWSPEARTPAVKVQLPLAFAVVVAKEAALSNSSTVLSACAVPVKVGVVSLVMLSLLDEPVSLSAVRSGVDGGAGGAWNT